MSNLLILSLLVVYIYVCFHFDLSVVEANLI